MIAWLFPALLAGLAVAAAPVLIHWLLRPRARRQVFPALRLLRAAHNDGMRRQRVHHWLLLAVRTLLLIALVLGAARPLLRSAAAVGTSAAPVAAVFCLDDSASMNYRTPSGSRRQAAVAWAESLLADAQRFPEGSRFCVLTGSSCDGPTAAAPWTRDRAAAARALSAQPPGPHDRGVQTLLAAAAAPPQAPPLKGGDGGGRADAREEARETYLFTDLAAHAWQQTSKRQNVKTSKPEIRNSELATRNSELTTGHRALGTGHSALFILDVGQPENHNASITPHWLPEQRDDAGVISLPPGRPATLSSWLCTGDEPIETQVELWLDGTIVERSQPLQLSARTTRMTDVRLPPLPTGVHFAELRLDRPDRLADDNTAYFVVDVAPRIRVAVLSPDDSPDAHSEARRFAALLAPDALPEERRPFEVELLPPSAIDKPALDEARMIVWLEPAAALSDRIERLRQLVDAGRTLLIVAGPQMNCSTTSPFASLGVTPVRIESPAEPLEFAPDPADSGPTSLLNHAVYRYIHLQPSRAAIVTQRLANGDPAIVEARMGRGRIIWWAFSLRADWSDMGVRAAPILLRLHALARAAWPAAHRTANVYCDEEASILAPSAVSAVHVARLTPGSSDAASFTQPTIGGVTIKLPTRSAGLYRVTTPIAAASQPNPRRTVAAATESPIGGVAVNLRSSESDAQRMSDDAIRSLLADQHPTIAHQHGDLPAVRRGPAVALPLDGYLLAAALALLFLEAALARAAYRSAPRNLPAAAL